MVILCFTCLTSAAHADRKLQAVEGQTQDCETSGISSLWQAESGAWMGSSKIEWRQCADGNDYVADCTHQGSGVSMESCSCTVNTSLAFEGSCQGLISSDDLQEASRQCCGFFKP
ncbi:MAG TPA: hypothetical protein VE954_40080 [Oligoflexus sp.]|uniref:hypothetical protein n=1 Tax=Oligoflexus sp. TaxID=1971216 RepID=UPI002D73ECE0|nr:hypothetical protein [Oligoflexus sp.]HYX39341.1 hypothetical protein [Oligoflexus sp.]